MQIKVFKAGNMKDAMTVMKAELGEDAVILHSKKYKEGGILGLGSREVVEITAAVEETSMPKKTELPRLKHPTVAPNSLLTRYKTDGTSQGVAEAQQRVDQLSQLDTLAEKIAAQKAQAPEPQNNFENILQATQEESVSVNLSTQEISQPVETSSQETSQPVETSSQETSQPVETSPQETSQPVETSPQESSQLVETSPQESSQPVETSPQEISQPVETSPQESSKPIETSQQETSQPVETSPQESSKPVETSPQESSQPVETSPQESSKPIETSPQETSQPVETSPQETSQPVETSPQETSQPVENPPQESSQPAPVFTQEQMAQTQAMIMAQFNQMQMMQQAAIAQAQAQAAEQMRLQQEQAQAQQAALAQQASLAQPVTNSHNEEKIKHLEEEIAQMKALLAEVLGRESKKGVISLHEALKLQEVDEEVLTEMATQSTAGETLVDIHTPAAKSTLINYLNEHVKFSDGVKLNRHGVRIVALLGTTGVGKTTTLAKIAAKFVLEQRTNVALITADTYRISAVEQLKTYSDILELPLEIVYNPAELAAAIERHRDKELILIDTAGRSQHNDYQLRELEEFLRVNPRIEKHLVISSTTKFTDAKQIMNKFAQVEPDKIIFTKTDETGSLGMIINLLRNNNCSLSYVTTGQSVPDDIERANAEILVNLLFKKVEDRD